MLDFRGVPPLLVPATVLSSGEHVLFLEKHSKNSTLAY